MRLVLSIILSFFGLSLAYTQSLLSEQLFTDKFNRMPLSASMLNKEYEGSPYMVDTFMTGAMLLETSTYKLPMRYNIYQDLMEVKYKGRDMMILPHEKLGMILLGGHQMIGARFEYEDKNTTGFLFVLDSGEVMLLKKRNVSFEEGRLARAQEAAPKPARFKDSPDAYFFKIGSEVHHLKSVKMIPDLFPKQRRKLETYIDKNKIKLKEGKLKALLKYYHSIPKS